MRCGGEPRARARAGHEPLITETSTFTKLVWALVAACALGALLLYSAVDDPSEAALVERGLVVEADEADAAREPSAAPPPAAEAAESAAEREAHARFDAERARERTAREEEAARLARASVPIVMYSTSWCGVCQGARAYLVARGVRFTEYDVESNEAARAALLRLNPARSVPTFDIGGEVLTGFSEAAFEAKLDTAVARLTP